MYRLTLVILFLMVTPLYGGSWQSSEERRSTRELGRGGMHYHAKRHMVPNDSEAMKRPAAPIRNKGNRKKMNRKPSGHLTPLKEDDIGNDEVVSVAIGPPPLRPVYDKLSRKNALKNRTEAANSVLGSSGGSRYQGATNIIKDVLAQLGREFLNHQVNEDFVFGQYVGNSMRNLTSDLKLKMQHEILELVIRYQKISKGEVVTAKPEPEKSPLPSLRDNKIKVSNETEDQWPDFSNLATIVG